MNKILLFGLVIVIIAGAGYYFFREGRIQIPMNGKPTGNTTNTLPNPSDPDAPVTAVVAENLDTPWAIAFLPEGDMLVTERGGAVKKITKDGTATEVGTIPNVREISEGGLLGIALHPQFSTNQYVYLYYTYGTSGNNTRNRVVRMKFDGTKLIDEVTIVDDIPGAPNHDGGRIKFGPDGYLYVTTGDAQEPSRAQDQNSLAGKILRITDDGKPAPGNPFTNATYSYGHRNPQGIAWDSTGILWQTEHGPSPGGNDEVNKIEPGKNYGWDIITGNQTREGLVTPVATSGSSDTWAPGAAAVVGDKLYFGGLRGAALYTYPLAGGSVTEHFKNEFGRIREVILGPDGMLYITTSNRDGRGTPGAGDDKILRVNPAKL
jgi:glucose/arabinose dehydrogenase